MKSLLTQVLLFAANTNLGYRTFSYANKKFTNVFVTAFTKLDVTGLCFDKSNYRPKKLLWNSEPDFPLFALALQIV